MLGITRDMYTLIIQKCTYAHHCEKFKTLSTANRGIICRDVVYLITQRKLPTLVSRFEPSQNYLGAICSLYTHRLGGEG